jgi:ribosome-binding factor A
MSHRIQQINEVLKYELANIISREGILDNGLITVTFVSTSPDLRYAKIGISVLPDHLFGTALKRLKSNSTFFSKELKKKLRMKFIPKFDWTIDDREKHAAELEDYINHLDQ